MCIFGLKYRHIQINILETLVAAHTHTHTHTHSAFFLGGRRGMRTPKHFVNLTGESKNVKMLEFPLNQLQMCDGYLCDLLSFM
jgi:hypothetical protein